MKITIKIYLTPIKVTKNEQLSLRFGKELEKLQLSCIYGWNVNCYNCGKL